MNLKESTHPNNYTNNRSLPKNVYKSLRMRTKPITRCTKMFKMHNTCDILCNRCDIRDLDPWITAHIKWSRYLPQTWTRNTNISLVDLCSWIYSNVKNHSATWRIISKWQPELPLPFMHWICKCAVHLGTNVLCIKYKVLLLKDVTNHQDLLQRIPVLTTLLTRHCLGQSLIFANI